MVGHTSGCVCEGKCRDVSIKALEWKVGDGAIRETGVNWHVLGSSILPEPLWCPSFSAPCPPWQERLSSSTCSCYLHAMPSYTRPSYHGLRPPTSWAAQLFPPPSSLCRLLCLNKKSNEYICWNKLSSVIQKSLSLKFHEAVRWKLSLKNDKEQNNQARLSNESCFQFMVFGQGCSFQTLNQTWQYYLSENLFLSF